MSRSGQGGGPPLSREERERLMMEQMNAFMTGGSSPAPSPAPAPAPMPVPTPAPAPTTSSLPVWAGMTWNDIPSGTAPDHIIAACNLNPHMLTQLENNNKPLAEAIKSGSVSEVRTAMMMQSMEVSAKKFEEQKELNQLMSNPLDPEAQQKMAEMIREANVKENMELAMEEMPESFGRVIMLYVNAIVNGTAVKAFVDSGAQSTIMSIQCAERCGILRLVDRRFAGTAVGVGSCPIVGRVHMAPLRLGSTFFNCTFTVVDNPNMDFLFGLDMLKRHQCCIDLMRNVLVLQSEGKSEDVPFLQEHDLPEQAFGQEGRGAQLTQTSSSSSNTSSSAAHQAISGTTTTPTPSQQQQPTLASLKEEDVQKLLNLGFARTQAENALRSTDGDVGLAASLLSPE